MPAANSPRAFGICDLLGGPTHSVSLHARQVLTRACVDAHHVSGLNEQGHFQRHPRLQRDLLGGAGGRIAGIAGRSVRDLEVNRDRQLDSHRLSLVHLDVDGDPLLEIRDHSLYP